jgi:predicted PurR-regulated permease PerM
MVEPMIPSNSPPWSRTTKTIVVVAALLLLALLVMRFRTLLAMLVVAAILAYLLDPLIVFIDKRTNIRRGIVIAVVYIVLAAALIGGFFALGVASYQQAANLIEQTPDLIENVAASIAALVNRTEPIAIGPLSLDPSVVAWDRLPEQLLGLVEPLLSQSGGVVSRFATSTVRTVFNLLFIFVLSIYLATDLPRFGGYVKSFAQQPGYREDAERLMPQLRHVWSAYLRGQIILSLVIFLTVWIGLTLLGVQNSLALGLLAGFLEFLPNLGPVISAGVTVLVAFFQPGNYLGLESWQYALVILGLMIVIQQLENHLLVPRIVGGALDLHPIIVIVGLFMGASLAGILGAILAAPIIASLKLFGHYAWRKLFDLPPFPDEEPIDDPPPHLFLPE